MIVFLLGVIFDSGFSFPDQVSSVRKSCFYHIRDFARIRRPLPESVSISVANAFVSSHFDYCNSLLESISNYDLRWLQNIQNSLCRIFFGNLDIVKIIWLHIWNLFTGFLSDNILIFKWNLLTYKITKLGLPPYFKPYFVPYTCQMATRRSDPTKSFLNRDII